MKESAYMSVAVDPGYILADQRRMQQARNYFAWQCRLMLNILGRRVVEIGCGIGNFTGMLLPGRAVMALDIEPQCVEQIRARYASAGNLEVIVSDWAAPDWDQESRRRLSAFRADSCVCLNTLEHILDDREAVNRMAAILEPGGVIVLLLPAFPALYGPIDRKLGHHRRYTKKSVRNLATAAKLRVESMRYMNAIGFFGWWINAHVLKRQAQSPAQIRFFDRFVVPPQSWLENVIAPPFGQSLLVVLRK